MSKYSFDNENPHRVNIKGGEGEGAVHHRVNGGAGTNCNFIVLLEMPPETSIGLHKHDATDEEIYIVISGQGEMQEGDKIFKVGEGDVLINSPGEQHALKNIGSEPLKVVAVDVEAKG